LLPVFGVPTGNECQLAVSNSAPASAGTALRLRVQRRGEIDRFLVEIQDELDRRARWRPQPPTGGASNESTA
jgi:predicted polyphosphate/ATP-dependent NAD kinase